MTKFFYAKLAATNLRKNSRASVPFLVASTFTIMMFYVFSSLSTNPDILDMKGGWTLSSILNFGWIILFAFSAVFLLYIHSFLSKNRKKELGLYHLLGMEKKHLARLVFWETVYFAAFSLTLGILLGILLDKLLFLGIARILGDSVGLGFHISRGVVFGCFRLFGVIYLILFGFSLLQVWFTDPIQLLKAEQTGEREPKAKWLMAVIGLACIGVGYFLSVTIKSPLDAMNTFFIAVLLVIVGTYFLFTAGSISLLKLLRKNKNYYYKPRHFIGISSMLYRMKQNAVGLANICILSTMVLVTVSTTFCLAAGIQDSINLRVAFDVTFDINDNFPDRETAVQNNEEFRRYLTDAALQQGLTEEHTVTLPYYNFPTYRQKDGSFVHEFETGDSQLNSTLLFVSVEDYNQYTNQNIILQPNQVYLYAVKNNFSGNSITCFGKTLEIVQQLKDFPCPPLAAVDIFENYIIIAAPETIAEIRKNSNPDIDYEVRMLMGVNFDEGTDSAVQIEKGAAIQNAMFEHEFTGYSYIRADEVEEQIGMNGGLFFVGILLGLLFSVAAALIIYYKQISEGMADQKRFEILQKVGMSQAEVRKTIHSQILTVFFLPLIVAGIHTAFAFPLLSKLIQLLGFLNTPLFILTTLVVFAGFGVLYAVVYLVTSKVYYRIVKR